VQDGAGRTLGEYGASGTKPFAEYIWLQPDNDTAGVFGGDDGTNRWLPLAVVTANGAGGTQSLHWLASTHLGVPVASSNSAGTTTTLTGITLLGFPGQTQTLADLYYSQYRDYDPTTGRYIQADPIGLNGDPNPYVYAGANPVGKVDPWGLTTTLITTGEDSIMNSHSSLYIDGENSVLYDPGGTFAESMNCGSGQACWGEEAKTAYNRMIEAYRHSGNVRIITIRTTPAEEEQIRRLIDEYGGRAPFYCARTISDILSDLRSFRFIEGSWLPTRLADQVSRHNRVERDVTLPMFGAISPPPIPTLNGN